MASARSGLNPTFEHLRFLGRGRGRHQAGRGDDLVKRPERWAWVVAAIAVVVLIWLVSRRDGEEGDGKPAFAVAERGPITEIVSTTGRVVPNRDVEIKCKASGEVISLPHDVSDKVKKGDLLVKLDPINEQRRVSLAEIALSSSRARVEQRRTALATAEINLATSRKRAAAALASAKARSEDANAKAVRAKLLLHWRAGRRTTRRAPRPFRRRASSRTPGRERKSSRPNSSRSRRNARTSSSRRRRSSPTRSRSPTRTSGSGRPWSTRPSTASSPRGTSR
jgi:multidrug efflux pump subunit AcrA (membrane-fusion protein)